MVNKKNITCPTCGKKNTWVPENTFKPFCSDRCKLIDLGDWADEKHRVAGETIDPHNTNEENEED
jgi:endogenous inhibitor of DNA gyrase (YacG/DUF329 family)